jgi:hypothetical protein
MPLGRTKKNKGADTDLPAEIVIAIVVAMFLILGGLMYFCPGVDEDSEKYRVKRENSFFKKKKRGKRGAGARGGRGPPPTETTATAVAPPPLTFQVEVPAGVDPGAQMTVPAPDGSLVDVIVPDGLTPGSLFAVAMAPPAPLPPPPPEAPQPFAGHGIV